MALTCFRHFRALMRKNFIIYLRTPGCSLVELLAPVILFIGLTLIRNMVPVTPTDPVGMTSKKLPVWVGAPNVDGAWSHDNNNKEMNNVLRPLCEYTNYTDRHYTDPAHYDMGWDWESA